MIQVWGICCEYAVVLLYAIVFIYASHNLWIQMQISGTALVLDEIINHVQYLQRQVEVLIFGFYHLPILWEVIENISVYMIRELKIMQDWSVNMALLFFLRFFPFCLRS